MNLHEPSPLTNQEMFDRAVRGLRASRWIEAATRDSHGGAVCVYFDRETGRRCAWGHVDPLGTEDFTKAATVGTLRMMEVGLAAQLHPDDMPFARKLQETHDSVMLKYTGDDIPIVLEMRMAEFGRKNDLTWPLD